MTAYFEQFIMPERGHYHAEVWLAGNNGERVDGTHLPSGDSIVNVRHYDVFGDSPEWRDNLPPNIEISPPGTKWARDLTGAGIDPSAPPIYFDVIVSAVAEDVSAHLTDVPTAVPSGAVATHKDLLHRKNVTIPSNFMDTTWFRKRLLGASQLIPWDIWSDSIGAQGLGVSPNDIATRRNFGMAGLFETAMKSAYGDGGSGYLSYEYSTITGSWTFAEMGFGGAAARTTGAGSLQWTGIFGTIVRVFIKNVGVTGTVRARVDGGAWTSVTTPSAPFGTAFDPLSIDFPGLPDVSHTVDVEWVSGACVVSGVYAARTTGFNLRRFGCNGRSASQYSLAPDTYGKVITATGTPTTITCASPGWFSSRFVDKYLQASGVPQSAKITAVASATSMTIDKSVTASATVDGIVCDFDPLGSIIPGMTTNFAPFLESAGCGYPVGVAVCLGANDPIHAGRRTERYRDGLSRILDPYFTTVTETNPDAPTIVIFREHQGKWIDVENSWQAIASVQSSMADAVGAALIDSWAIGGRMLQYSEDRGWHSGDVIHPANAGHKALYADPWIAVATLASL